MHQLQSHIMLSRRKFSTLFNNEIEVPCLCYDYQNHIQVNFPNREWPNKFIHSSAYKFLHARNI